MNKPLYQCAVCENRWFETIEELHSHEQEFHNPQEDREISMRSAGGPFPCPECGLQLETPERMEKHLVREHPQRGGMGQAPIQDRRGSKGTS
jgi:predicted RNA-binding Zn-ribbon protein involved in translation (DUF1610 family)